MTCLFPFYEKYILNQKKTDKNGVGFKTSLPALIKKYRQKIYVKPITDLFTWREAKDLYDTDDIG